MVRRLCGAESAYMWRGGRRQAAVSPWSSVQERERESLCGSMCFSLTNGVSLGPPSSYLCVCVCVTSTRPCWCICWPPGPDSLNPHSVDPHSGAQTEPTACPRDVQLVCVGVCHQQEAVGGGVVPTWSRRPYTLYLYTECMYTHTPIQHDMQPRIQALVHGLVPL